MICDELELITTGILSVLTFSAPPRIKKSKSKLAEVKVSEGESAVLPCHVTGNPQPWISWSRDGKTLQNSTRKSGLMLPATHGNMTGLYTCVAGNKAGIDEYQVLLLVTSCEHQSSGVKHRTKGKMSNTWCTALRSEWTGKRKCCVKRCMHEVPNKHSCRKNKNKNTLSQRLLDFLVLIGSTGH